MRMKSDPMFSDTKNMNVGDTVGYDPSKEGTGGYEEGVIATVYRFSLILESGKAIGVARVLMHRRPSAAMQALPRPAPLPPQLAAPGKPKEKPWFIRSDEDEQPPKRYVSFPF